MKKIQKIWEQIAIPIFSGLVGLLISGLINFFLIEAETETIAKQEMENTERFNVAIFNDLSDLIGQSEMVSLSIATEIATGKFDPYSDEGQVMLDRYSAGMSIFRAIHVAPNACIASVSPVEGNRPAIDYCISSNPFEFADVNKLIRNKEARLEGPYPLPQGGSGYVFHRPVFLDDGEYWGLVSVVLGVESLIDVIVQEATEDEMIFRLALNAGASDEIVVYNSLQKDSLFTSEFVGQVGGSKIAIASGPRDSDFGTLAQLRQRALVSTVTFPIILFGYAFFTQRNRRTIRRLKEISNLVPTVIFRLLVDRDGKLSFEYVSDGCERFLGLTAKEIILNPLSLMQGFKPEDALIARSRVTAARTPGEIWSQRIKLLEPIGPTSSIQIEATFEKVSGRVFQWNGIVTDATDAASRDQALELSETALALLGEGVVILNGDLQIQLINPEVTRVTGFELGQVSGKSLEDFGSGLNDPGIFREIKEELVTNGFWRGELMNRYRDGSEHRDVVTLSAVMEEEGEISRVLMVMNSTQRSIVDPVSGLANRAQFEEDLALAIQRAEKFGNRVAMLQVGISGIGSINDSFGHKVGDRVLREVGQRLLPFASSGKALGRLGGTEFGLFREFRGDEEDLQSVSNEILEKLSIPFPHDSLNVLVSPALGLAVYPDDSNSMGELRSHADQAYKSSAKGGESKIAYFSKSLEESAKTRSYLTSFLQDAIDDRKIEFYYQPIIRLEDKKIVKAEVLSRWFDERVGAIGPDVFIPLAEKANLIAELGKQCLETVLLTMQEVRALGTQVQFSINVSPIEFVSSDFSSAKALTFSAHPDANLADLVFEITEGTLLENKELVMNRISEFRSHGIRFAIDDFGSGYSSLSYLQQLDVEFLKIDKSFVDGLETVKGLELMKSIVGIAHALGMEVIAEGVELEIQAELLTQIGCEYAQGYLFSRPVPKKDFLSLLGKS